MNHYDDLQRFKDKMHIPELDFKTFPAHDQAQEQGKWAIINQLLPATEANVLAAGGHISQRAPQPVSEDTFALPETPPGKLNAVTESVPDLIHTIVQGVEAQLAVASRQNQTDPVPAHIRAEEADSVSVNFARLFSPVAVGIAPATEKNQPLNILLERIASCR